MNKRLKRPGVVVCLILATLLLASGQRYRRPSGP